MAWPKGKPRPDGAGRKKGKTNEVTATVKAAVKAAFDDLQSVKGASLRDWAKKNPGEFYKIAAKLIPHELSGPDGGEITVVIRKMDED